MTYPGRVKNGMVVLDEPASLPDGTRVRVEPVSADSGCFAGLKEKFDPKALEAMRANLTVPQYEALLAIASQGGPDVDAVNRVRTASMV